MIPPPQYYTRILIIAVGIVLSIGPLQAQSSGEPGEVMKEKQWLGWWIIEQPEGDNLYLTIKAHGRASSFFSGDGSNKIDQGTWIYEGNHIVITWQDGYRDVLDQGAKSVLHTTNAPGVAIDSARSMGAVAKRLQEDEIGSLVDEESKGVMGGDPMRSPTENRRTPPNRSDFIGFWEVQRLRGTAIYLFLKRGGKAFRAESARKGRDLIIGEWEDQGGSAHITWVDGTTDTIKRSGATYTFNGYDANGAIGSREISSAVAQVDAARVSEFFNLGTGPASTPDYFIGYWKAQDLQGEVYYINVDRWSQAARFIYSRGVEISKETGRWSMVGDGVHVTWDDGTQNTLRAFVDGVRLASYAPGTAVTGVPLNVNKTQKVLKENFDLFLSDAREEIEEIERAALARQRAQEDALRRAQKEAQRRIEKEAKARALAEARLKAEGEARRLAEQDARRQAEAIAREKTLAEERQQEAELARQRAIEDARARAIAAAQRQAENEQRRREEEASRLASMDSQRRAEEQERIRKREEAQRILDEKAQQRGESLAKERAREVEETRRHAAEDSRIRAEEVAQARAKREVEARKRADNLARQRAAEEARIRALPPKLETLEQKARRLANVRPRHLLEEEARREAKLLPPAAIEQEARQRAGYLTYASLQEEARQSAGVRSPEVLRSEASAIAETRATTQIQSAEQRHASISQGSELKVAAQRIARKRAGPVPSSPLSGPQAQEYREGTGVAFWRVENANGNNYFINLLPDGGAHSTDARSPRGFNGRRGRWSAMAEGYAISWEDGERARIGPYDGGHALFGYSSESVGQGPGQFMSPVEQVAPANAEIWRTSFEDTFQSEKVDANKWVTYAPSGIPSNTEIAGFNPENLKIDDGKLVISANDYGMTANGRYLQYTSGILSTQGKFAQVYGYFEIRFRAPEGQGIRPIIWLTSETTGDHIHLIDILGQEPDKAYFESKRGDRDSIDTAELKGTDFSRAFHTIGLRWSPEELITYVNGSERERITGSIPNTPLVLTAGILVGDGKTGPPSGWTPFPAKLEIDYVRAFERNTDFIGLHRSEVAKKRAEAEASFDKETEAYKGRERAYFVEELATLTNQENLRFNGEIASIRSDEQVYAATEYRRLEEEDRTRFEATLSQLERNQTERYEAALSALKAAEQARLDGILANLEAKENSRYEAEFARLKAEEEARRQVELARLRAEEEARRKVAEEARRRAEEEATRIAEERRRAEEEARRIAQVEAQRRAEEEARRQVELAQQREEREAMLAAKAEEARLIAKARARESAEERERKRLERDARMQAAIARKEAEAAAKAQREAEATLATRSTEFERTPAERTAPAPVAIQRSRPTSRGSPPTTGRSIFEDAFEGGPLLGPAWTLGSGLAANSEEEESIPMDGNVSQKNGRLVLVAQNERVIYEGERRSYSGGTVTTTSSIPGSYGYIEFQAKAPMGQGLSSSFRMLDEVTNKEVVAIHISGLEPDRIHMFVNSGESTSMAATWKGTDFSLSFHSVGIAWSNEYLIFYVDGSEIERLNRGVPEGPVKLSFSLGVGGKRGGAVSGWTSFPARFEVESIRFTR